MRHGDHALFTKLNLDSEVQQQWIDAGKAKWKNKENAAAFNYFKAALMGVHAKVYQNLPAIFIKTTSRINISFYLSEGRDGTCKNGINIIYTNLANKKSNWNGSASTYFENPKSLFSNFHTNSQAVLQNMLAEKLNIIMQPYKDAIPLLLAWSDTAWQTPANRDAIQPLLKNLATNLVNVFPEVAETHLLAARALFYEGDKDSAAKAYLNYIKLKPGKPLTDTIQTRNESILDAQIHQHSLLFWTEQNKTDASVAKAKRNVTYLLMYMPKILPNLDKAFITICATTILSAIKILDSSDQLKWLKSAFDSDKQSQLYQILQEGGVLAAAQQQYRTADQAKFTASRREDTNSGFFKPDLADTKAEIRKDNELIMDLSKKLLLLTQEKGNLDLLLTLSNDSSEVTIKSKNKPFLETIHRMLEYPKDCLIESKDQSHSLSLNLKELQARLRERLEPPVGPTHQL